MNREKLKAQLIIDEGRKLKLYKDEYGNITGGVGHNFTDRGISPKVCEVMEDEDIDTAVNDLSQFKWFSALSDVRQNVVINMCFNMGITRFRGFHHMIEAIEAGDYSKAAAEMLDSAWPSQVGDRAKRLAKEMETDEF